MSNKTLMSSSLPHWTCCIDTAAEDLPPTLIIAVASLTRSSRAVCSLMLSALLAGKCHTSMTMESNKIKTFSILQYFFHVSFRIPFNNNCQIYVHTHSLSELCASSVCTPSFSVFEFTSTCIIRILSSKLVFLFNFSMWISFPC